MYPRIGFWETNPPESGYLRGVVEQAIARLREVLRGTDYEGKVYLVGGYVRDKLLNRPRPTIWTSCWRATHSPWRDGSMSMALRSMHPWSTLASALRW